MNEDIIQYTEEICRHRWLALCRGLNGEPFIRESPGGVLIVPLTDAGEVLFVIEPAVMDGSSIMSLPTGTLEKGESPIETANRELREEIGYKAGRLHVLSEIHPLARHAEWRMHAVLARDLLWGKLSGDEKHEVVVEPFLFSRFEELVDTRRLLDSSCIAALFLARRFLEREHIA